MPQDRKLFESPIGKKSVMYQRNLEQEKAILDQGTKQFVKAVEDRKQVEARCLQEIEEYRKAGDKKGLKEAQKYWKYHREMRVNAEKELEDATLKLQEKAQKTAEKFEIQRVLRMSAAKRREYFKDVAEKVKAEKLKADAEYNSLIARKNAITGNDTASDDQRAAIQKQIDENRSYKQSLDTSGAASENFSQKLLSFFNSPVAAAKARRADARDSAFDAITTLDEKKDKAEAADNAHKKSLEEEKKLTKQIDDAKKRGDQEELDRLNTLLHAQKQNSADLLAEKEKSDNEAAEASKEVTKAFFKEVGASVEQAFGTLIEDTTKGIDSALDDMFGSQGRMMGRLQGSAIDWADTVNSVSNTVGFSGIVSKKSIVKKMEELVDKGVAYNIEMRAFLAETSENIAATFDATNDTLLRMIRLQQSDSTVARLGMEAMLTELLNQMFQDTSYLANSISDSVSAAVLDTSAMLSKNQSLEFEYTLQKWLGALYSLGMSTEGVANIARGVNYIGTGDIAKLSEDASLMTIFQFAASRSQGKSLAELFDSQLTGSDLNYLLKSLIETLSNIEETSSSKLTRTAWADVLGMSVTDLTTFSALTSSEINKIYNSTANYNTMLQETADELADVGNRLNISKLVDTAIQNVEVGVASDIGKTAVGYGTWKALNLLEHYVGEVPIPSILAAGFGLSSDIDLLNVAKTGIAGMGLIGELVQGVMALANGGVTDLSTWNFSEYTTRTKNNSLSILPQGVSKKGSFATKLGIGSTDGSDFELITEETAKQKAYDSAGVTSEELEADKDIYKKIYESISNGESVNVLSVLQNIQDLLSQERVFYTSIVGVASSSDLEKVSVLSSQLTSSSVVTSVSSSNSSQGNSTPNLVSGTGTSGSQSNDNLEAIITAAVESALRAVAGSSMGSGLPVYVTNINGYEGG